MNNKIKTFCVFIILILFSFPVYAESYGKPSITKTIFQLIFYTIIFIFIIFFSLYGTKFLSKNFKGMTNSKYINILDAINIPGGSKIVLTKINNKIYVLATSNNGTSVLDIIDENELPLIEEKFDGYLSKENLNYTKIIDFIKSSFDKINKKKDKEGNKNEKQD